MGNNVVVSALTMKLLFASDYRLLPHPESILVQTALLSSSKREPEIGTSRLLLTEIQMSVVEPPYSVSNTMPWPMSAERPVSNSSVEHYSAHAAKGRNMLARERCYQFQRLLGSWCSICRFVAVIICFMSSCAHRLAVIFA